MNARTWIHLALALLSVLLAAAAGSFLSHLGCGRTIEDLVSDRVFAAAPHPPSTKILIVDLGPDFRPGNDFDWERNRAAKCSQLARAIETLMDAGALGIALDYHFGPRIRMGRDLDSSPKATPGHDDLTYCTPRSDADPLYRVLSRYAEKLVIPVYLQLAPGASPVDRGQVQPPVDHVRRLRGLQIGMVNVPEQDGTVREMPAYGRAVDGMHYYGFGVLAARLAIRNAPIKHAHGSLFVGDRSVSLSPGGMLRFAKHQFATDVPLDLLAPPATTPVPDLVRQRIKDALVIIGNRNTCACRLGDEVDGDLFRTPYGTLSGMEIHANVAATVLGGRGLTTYPAAVLLTITGLVALSAFLIGRMFKLGSGLILGFALLLATTAAVIWLRHAQQTFVPLVGAVVAGGMAYVLGLGLRARALGIDRLRLWSAFRHYLSPTVIQQMLADPKAISLGGERREATLLFSDIRNFSSFSETMPPEVLSSFLSECFDELTKAVMRHQGYLDKYIGDAMMAMFGAPVPRSAEEHARQSCRAALEMARVLDPLNEKWAKEQLPAVSVGIGLNTGMVSVGNMGSKARFNYTAVGDAVNLASRLEGLTKEYGTQILVGSRTWGLARAEFIFREVDLVRVKGRDEPERVFELLGCKEEGAPLDVAAYETALEAYRQRDFAGARTQLDQLFRTRPDDGPGRTLLGRISALESNPPGPGWDGVYTMTKK
jgi:class 3 adenylate cyclase/CHASE2 domain-containing sensor protein